MKKNTLVNYYGEYKNCHHITYQIVKVWNTPTGKKFYDLRSVRKPIIIKDNYYHELYSVEDKELEILQYI